VARKVCMAVLGSRDLFEVAMREFDFPSHDNLQVRGHPIVFGYVFSVDLTIKVLNIRYRDRIGWRFFISDIGYQGRNQGYVCISGAHIGHYI